MAACRFGSKDGEVNAIATTRASEDGETMTMTVRTPEGEQINVVVYEKIRYPIMVYNNPNRTQINLDATLMDQIADFDSVVTFVIFVVC